MRFKAIVIVGVVVAGIAIFSIIALWAIMGSSSPQSKQLNEVKDGFSKGILSLIDYCGNASLTPGISECMAGFNRIEEMCREPTLHVNACQDPRIREYIAANANKSDNPPSTELISSLHKISELKAADILVQNLNPLHVGDNRSITVQTMGEGGIGYSEYLKQNFHVPLLYFDNAGPIYFVNSMTDAVYDHCSSGTNAKSGFYCSWRGYAPHDLRGRLVFFYEVDYSSKDNHAANGDYVVDATNGQVFSFLTSVR